MDPAAIPSAAAEPRVLGDFVLGDKLGEGGFGTVYRAEQRTLHRPAVVKVIRAALVAHRDTAERFILEARLASRFDHPYAAHVYAFGTEPGGSMWIAMELVKGTPLDELVARTGPIGLERFAPLMERLCDVIQAAHEQQIIHRDIKPSNVMVIARGGRLTPKLLDFGIAKTLQPEPAFATPGSRIAATTPTLALTSSQSSRSRRPSEIDRIGADATMNASAGSTDDTVDVAVDATAASAGPSTAKLATDNTAASKSGIPSDTIAASIAASGNLTRAGQILGSPPYMAPEQWADAGRVGPWTDQYALALLAYEALVGKRAFTADSLEAFRTLHETSPLPPLPPHLPVAVHAVLARAAAKDPTQRYPSLNELASAFKEAAFEGAVSVDDAWAVSLPPAIRTAWMDRAPAPIAETIGALVTARTASRIVDRVRMVAGVLARWSGVLALACQSKLGRVEGGGRAHELVLGCRRRALHDTEWLELATALAQPFASNPEAWPIPELASYVSDRRASGLRAFLDSDRVATANEATLRQVAEEAIGKLVEILESASWLLEYGLAHSTATGLERWTGVGSDERPLCTLTRSFGEPGEIAVVDADGAPVVKLSPLVTVAAPLPGQRDEMFVFAGPARDPAASRSIAHPRGYERDDHETWAWFAHHLLEVEEGQARTIDEERSPYPGLAAFTSDDHGSFVGRETEVVELVNRLRDQRIVAVVGPSGVGKSSFLAAGVVPVLPGSWRAVTTRPSATPIAALRTLVDRTAAPYRDGPRRELPETAEALGDAIAESAQRAGTTLVVIVDQAEELLTMCHDDAERERFAAALARAATSDRVRIVLSLRDDFLVRVDEIAGWRGQVARGVQVLRMPDPRDLERAIAVPARRCGYDFDDPALPRAIVDEVADQPGALPLVAFAAAELWQRRDRHFKRLTRAAYAEIGGVSGALVQHADSVVDRLPAAERRLVRLAFRRLLTTDGTRASIGRSELASSLGTPTDAERVIELLLASRLVVSRDDEAGERLEIIHESLATTWPRLATWRIEDAASTRMQERLAAAARHWDESGRPPALLWRGAVLEDLRRLGADANEGSAQSPLERAFASESMASARRARRRKIAVVAGAFAVLAAGTAALAWTNRRIETQRQAAIDRLAASFEQQGRLALQDGDAPRALLFLAESRRFGARGAGGDFLINHAAASLESAVEIIGYTDSPITLAQILPHSIVAIGSDKSLRWWHGRSSQLLADDVMDAIEVGDMVLATDTRGGLSAYNRSGRRWKVEDARALRVVANASSGLALGYGVAASGARVYAIADGALLAELPAKGRVSAGTIDNQRVAIGTTIGSVEIVDPKTGGTLGHCPGHADLVTRMQFTPDGTALVTASGDREVHVCDLATGTLRHRLIGHRNHVSALAISEDGKVAATGSRDGGVFIWDLERGIAQVSFDLGSAVKVLALSPDSEQLATTARDGTVRLWHRASGAAIGSLQGHGGAVSQVRWEGARMITTSMDGSIRRWDLPRAARMQLASHGAPITSFDMDGDVAITAGGRRVVVWDLESRTPIATLDHETAVNDVILARDLHRLATVDSDGAAVWWSLDGKRLGTIATTGVAAATFLPDHTFVTAHEAGMVRWWREGQELAHVDVGHSGWLVVDPSGRWLIVKRKYEEIGHHTVIEISTRKIVTTIPARPKNRVTFGDRALAVSRGPEVEVFEPGTWRTLRKLVGHQGAIANMWLLPDGRTITSGDDARLVVWSREGVMLQTLATGGDIILTLNGSPDGTLIAAIGYEGTLRLFDAKTLNKLLELPGHRGFSAFLRFTADSNSVVSAGNDGRLLRWDVRHPTRTPAELAELVRCRVPLRLEGDLAVPRTLDLSDPTCRR